MEFEGKPIQIEPGKTYVLESDYPIDPERANAYCKMLSESTGAKFVMISGGIKIARENTEQELRESIALDILDYADRGYAGAASSDDVRILEVAEYIKTALQVAAGIARGK